MSHNYLGRVVIGLAAGSVAALSLAPLAAAETPDTPRPGDTSAAAAVTDLRQLGYNVQMNWVNGISTESLSRCHLTNVNTTNGNTAYVDVVCPQ
ncbi:MAG TPA: hypothetical protein VFW21_01590 [Mycobacterium sp.]|nr:hypothetical protein [Mycobacterium sp.]